MLMALNAKHKLSFFDGSISQPPPNDPFVGVCSRYNNMGHFLDSSYRFQRDVVDSLLYLDNAQAIWVDLRDQFHQSNAPHIFLDQAIVERFVLRFP
ncbi:hypothetical protein CK203_111567 [Vitis vinifera]|uniref:Uncharacterized protein n=1 Tax=Vitis vinifera TaxID=29760 RepID=A0A438BQU9_VITVI|nr:hypothetical protein CK203_111567 [Vitis vinifera]